MVSVLIALAFAGQSNALATRLSPLISDGCVLQRDVPVKIWGVSAPGGAIEVDLTSRGETEVARTAAGADGAWQVSLAPHPAGGPYSIHVRGTNDLTVKNVEFGEVWVCSGQSNMGFVLSDALDAAKDIPASADPLLRMFTVPPTIADAPRDEVAGGQWVAASPKTSGDFSAVGYYFARRLRKALGVPIGMIHTSWGGTRIEAWTSHRENIALGLGLHEFETAEERAASDPVLAARLKAWRAAGSPTEPYADPGRAAFTAGWETEPDGPQWHDVAAPGDWSALGPEDLKSIDGGVWFRKEIQTPAELAGKDLTLNLGVIDDYDLTFFNGEQVGGLDATAPHAWDTPRSYVVPGRLVKAGANLIAVRNWDVRLGAGFNSEPSAMFLAGPNGFKLPLAGTWKYRIEIARPEPMGEDPNVASVLYNGMLYPLRNYTVKGAIWYQGESNDGDPNYAAQLEGMIQDWRNTFGNQQLYFFLTQLAPYGDDGPDKTGYALIREAQTTAARKMARAGVSVITDVGDELDIHPKQKGPVGSRLALLAENVAYGLPTYAQSPRMKGTSAENGKIVVTFESVGSGLVVRGGVSSKVEVPADKLVGFQIAGADGVFVPAEARIVGRDKVEVWSSQVGEPKYVRYGFVNFPVVNLWSKDGLPAEPFRSDPH